MILVCDKTKSERVTKLREKMITLGCPCAAAAISDLSRFMPLSLIITFTDVFDDVRRTPYDNVRVIAIGDGFVNSALNSTRVADEEEMLKEVKKYLFALFKIDEEMILPFGVIYNTGIFMSFDFFEIYGNIIIPTEREYFIFKYLHMTYKTGIYIPAQRVCEFCYPPSKMPKSDLEAAKNLAVHVANLNQKAYESVGYHIIHAKRFIGYTLVIE